MAMTMTIIMSSARTCIKKVTSVGRSEGRRGRVWKGAHSSVACMRCSQNDRISRLLWHKKSRLEKGMCHQHALAFETCQKLKLSTTRGRKELNVGKRSNIAATKSTGISICKRCSATDIAVRTGISILSYFCSRCTAATTDVAINLPCRPAAELRLVTEETSESGQPSGAPTL